MLRRTIHLHSFLLITALSTYIFAFNSNAAYLDAPHDSGEDFTAGCSTCHDMTAFGEANLIPNNAHAPLDIDDSLYNNICWTCHNDTDAVRVATHSSLQSDNDYGDWSVECWICHNQHTQEQAGNKFIRSRIDLSKISGVVKNGRGDVSYTGLGSLAHNDGLGPGGTDSTPNGICQVCHDHADIKHWKNDGTKAAIGVHAKYNGSDCMWCHQHTEGFKANFPDHDLKINDLPFCITCHPGPDIVADTHLSECLKCHDPSDYSMQSYLKLYLTETYTPPLNCDECHYGQFDEHIIDTAGHDRIHNSIKLGYDTDDNGLNDEILACDACHIPDLVQEHSTRRKVPCSACHENTSVKVQNAIAKGKSIADGGLEQFVFCDDCHNGDAGMPAGNLIANHHLTPYSNAGLCTRCHVVGPGARGPEKMPCFFCHGDGKPMDPKRAAANKHEFGPAIPVVTAEEIKNDEGIKDYRVCFSCHLDGGQGYKTDLIGSLPPLVTPMHALPTASVYWPTGYYKESGVWQTPALLIPSNAEPDMPVSLDEDPRLYTPEPVETTTWGKYSGFGNINYLARKEYRSSKYHVGGVIETWLNETPTNTDGDDYWGPRSLVIDMLMMDFPKVPISFGGNFDIPSYDGKGFIGKPTASGGSVSVTIQPVEAVAAGAQWRLDGGDWKNSSDTVSAVTERDNHLVEFKPLANWDEPASIDIEVTNTTTSITGALATYTGCTEDTILSVARITGDATPAFTWDLPDQVEVIEVSENHPGSVTCEVWLNNAGNLEEARGFIVTPSSDGKNCILSKNDVTPEGLYDLVIRTAGSSCFQNNTEITLNVTVTTGGVASPIAQAGGMITGPIDTLALSGNGSFLNLHGNLYVHKDGGNLSTFTIDENGFFGPVLDTATVHTGQMTRVSDTIIAVVYTQTVNGPYESIIKTYEILPDGTITGEKSTWIFHTWGIFAAVASTMYPHGTDENIFIVSWRSANVQQSILTVHIDPITGVMSPIDRIDNYTNSSNQYYLRHIDGEFYTMLLGSRLVTLRIGPDGSIIDPYAGTYNLGSGGYGGIIHLQGDVYAAVYSSANGPGTLKTLEIKAVGGSLSYRLINSFTFEPCSCGWYSGPSITKITDNVVGIHYFEYTGCFSPYSSTMLQTFEISNDGRITVPALDKYELAGSYGTRAPTLLPVNKDIFAYAVQDDKSEDPAFTGIKTLEISSDDDRDGKPGDLDNCPDIPNAGQIDSDGDGIGDVCDICPLDADNDLDQDGVCGDIDDCPAEIKDDRDGDLICDGSGFHGDMVGDNDNCPFTPNPDQADTDTDGMGDACDPCPNDINNDLDGDTICGDIDTCPLDAQNDRDSDGICANLDNCPNTPNNDQLDTDGDSLGDVCDPAPLVFDAGVDKNCDLLDDSTTPPVYFPPVSLTATSSSGNSMMLSWDDSMYGENGYRIERKAESCSADTLTFEPVTTVLGYDDFESGIDTTAWVPGASVLSANDREIPISVSDASGIAEVSLEGGAVKFHTIANDVDNNGYNVSYLEPKNFAQLFGDTDFDIQYDFSYSLVNSAAVQYHTYARLDSYFPATSGPNSIYVSRQRNRFHTGIQIDGEPWESGYLPTSDLSGKLRLIRKNRTLSGYTWNGSNWHKLHEHSKPLSVDTPPVWIGAVHHLNRNETGGQEITTYVDNFVFNTAGGMPVADLHMDLDEPGWTGSSGDVHDASVAGNHGTAFGGAGTVHDNQRGTVGSFDGIDDYVEISGTGTLENTTDSSFTFAAWAKPMSVPLANDTDDIRYSVIGRPGYHTSLQYNLNGKFRFVSFNDANIKTVAASNNTYDPGQWHHLVGVVDDEAKTVSLYIDGQFQVANPYTGDLREYSTSSYYIGAIPGAAYNFFFHGLIDDPRIFARALTHADVETLYNNGKQYIDTGLNGGTTYCYRIYPFQNNGCNNWDNHAAEFEMTTIGNCTDTDGDNVCDTLDECPNDNFNDPDDDGICAGAGFKAPKTGDNDNCPFLANPNQEDVDSNGVGDACYINQPVNISPIDSATGMSRSPVLDANAFFGGSGTHKASQWQISTASGINFDANIVYDSGSVVDFESHTVTATLESDTTYYWHVRYQDDMDYWSWYSFETSFTTAVGVPEGIAVAEWKFEEGAGNTVFDTIGTNDGSRIGAAWTTSGVSGGGMNFDGVNDYVDVPPISGFNEFSAEMWFKPDYGDDGINHTLLDLSDVPYRESFEAAGLQEVFECSGSLYTDEGRFIQTCDTDGDDYIHITNEIAHTGNNSIRARTTRLPAPNNGCPSSGAYMNFPKPIPITNDLVFDAWAYGMVSMGNIIRVDINDSGTARSITYGVITALPWQTPANDTATAKHYQLGLALNTWGNINRNIRADMTSKGLTWDAGDTITAIYIAAYCGLGTGSTQDFYVDDISFYKSSTQQKDSAIKLVKSNDNNLNLLIKDKAFTVSNSKIIQGNWNHVVITATGSAISMYVNGTREITNQPVTYNFPAVLTPYLGSNKIVKNLFDGTQDEVLLYNRALTPDEVQGRYVAGGLFITGVSPDQPINTTPVNGATDLTVVQPSLTASVFVDSDAGDTHLASRWQARMASGTYGDGDAYDSGETAGTNSHTISTVLLTNTAYNWRVQYQDSKGAWSIWSDETTFTISNSNPDQPVNTLPADGSTDAGYLQPTLTASAFSDTDASDTHQSSQWRVSTATGAGFDSNIVYDSGILTGSTNHTVGVNLSLDTTYYWQVRYQDSKNDWSSYSADTSFTISNNIPDQPVNSSPADGATDVPDLQPTLSASAFSDIDATDTHQASQWQISTGTGAAFDANIVYDSGTQAAATDHTAGVILSANVTYYWQVRYQDSKNEWSSYSSDTSFLIANNIPDQPVHTTPADGATNVYSLTPTLIASAYADSDGDSHQASQWRVSTDTGAAFNANIVYDSGAVAPTVSHTTASPLLTNTTYYWQVRYQDSMNEWSSYSNDTSFMISNALPDTPTNSTPANSAVDIPLTPTLTASTFSDSDAGDTQLASQWLISYSSGVDFDANLVYDSGVVADTDTHTVVGTGSFSTVYYWKVRYQDSRGDWSAYSSETSFTTIIRVPPDTPANITPADTATDVILTPTLTASAFVDSDTGDTHQASQWQIRKNGGIYGDADSYDSGAVAASTSHAVAASLDFSATYFWQVRYQDNNGLWSPYSPETSFNTIVFPPGAVSYWKFDEGINTTAADSLGTNTGTLLGGAGWTGAGVSGNALSLDGSSGYVSVGNMDYISTGTNGEYTTSVWIKFNTIKQSFFFGDEQSSNGGVMMQIDASGYIQTYKSGYHTSNFQVQTGQWYHIVFVQNSSGISLYIDSAYIGQIASSAFTQIESANNTEIGRFPLNSRYAHADMDEIIIFNRALNKTEITQMCEMTLGFGNCDGDGDTVADSSDNCPEAYNPNQHDADTDGIGNTCDPDYLPSLGGVAYWSFDEGSGTTAADSIGVNNGAITGATWITSNISGNALNFDGNDLVNVGSDSSLEVQSHTISAWIYLNANVTNGTSMMIYSRASDILASGYEWGIRGNSGNKLGYGYFGGSGWYLDTVNIPLNTWTHIAGVWDSAAGTVTFYINGTASAPLSTAAATITHVLTDDAYLGYQSQNMHINGRMDEIIIFNRALSGTEIAELY